MVLGIEPLIYETGFGFGMQNKDMVLVTLAAVASSCRIISIRTSCSSSGKTPSSQPVMPGLGPGIHVFCAAAEAWMAGPSPAMTMEGFCTSLQLQVRTRRQVIRPVDRVCVGRGNIERLGDHLDRLIHTSRDRHRQAHRAAHDR